MMTTSDKSDDKETKKKIKDAFALAHDFFDEGDHMNALKTTEKTISEYGMNYFCFAHHLLQGSIFFDLAGKTDITENKSVYLFASIDAYSMSTLLNPDYAYSMYGSARGLMALGDLLGLHNYYVEAVSKARLGLLKPQGIYQDLHTKIQALIVLATEKMNSNSAVTVPDTTNIANQMVLRKEEQGKPDPSFDEFSNFWLQMDEKTKRDFVVVDTKDLTEYVRCKYGDKVKENFQKCVCVMDDLQWRCWKCRICHQVNFCLTDCKRHILDNHVDKSVPQCALPKNVDKVLTKMIWSGNWEPVDAAKAADIIKCSRFKREEFVYVNGWCTKWPLANDEKRKSVLQEFAKLLKSSCENNTLSGSLWEWLIGYTEENLKLPGVPGSSLDKWCFFKNPHCICFLDLRNLEHILDYFRQLINADARIELVSTVANRFWENSLVKERIDLERGTCNLLLDERLLYEGEHHDFDDIGTVRTFKSSGIYENVKPEGHKIVSWVLDCPEIDTDFVYQVAEGIYKFEMWLAILRIVRGTVREVVFDCDKRQKMLTYDDMLSEAEALCDKEDQRKNANQRSRYALVLGMEFKERVNQDNSTKFCFLNLVRDVLQGVDSPRFEVLQDKDMECIYGLSTTVQNHIVRKNLRKLRNSLNEKFRLMDSKILLSEYTRKELNVFPKLSAIEYRLVVLPFVKMFLRDKLMEMIELRNTQKSIAAGNAGEGRPKKRRR